MSKVLEENDRGCTRVEGNALIQESTIEDAAEVRVRSEKGEQSGGGGKFSYDVRENEKGREIVHHSAGEGIHGPEWSLHILKKDGQTVDADQKRVIYARADRMEILVPVFDRHGREILGGQPSGASEVWTADRKYYAVEQSDGNFVVYGYDSDGIWGPLWDRWSHEGKR